MKVGIVMGGNAPYRQKQIQKFKEIEFVDEINIYYLNMAANSRSWQVNDYTDLNIKEEEMKSIFNTKYGSLDKDLIKIVKTNDVIILGGYEQPSFWTLAFYCRMFKKNYYIIIDGTNPKNCISKESTSKKLIKGYMINGATAVFGNGIVSKKFVEKFNSNKKVYNQYLTVDTNYIKSLEPEKDKLRIELRTKYGIQIDKKVILYSGRLIKRKNIDKLIEAISKLKDDNVQLIITGDGEEKENLIDLAKMLDVNMYITGFIKNQEELFKHYYLADVFILPSFNEPWGLVINEAMAAGLPIIASNECGAYMDLVRDGVNGFVIDPNNIDDIKSKISKIIYDDKLMKNMGINSKDIVKDWSFDSSKDSFKRMLIETCKI